MKKSVTDHIDELEKSGTEISDFKDKKGMTFKVAEYLKDNEIGGWAGLKIFHTK